MAEKELILDIPLEHEMNILGDMDKYLRKLQPYIPARYPPSRKDKKSPLTTFDEVFTEGSSLPFPFSPTLRPLFSLSPSVDCPPSTSLYLEPPYPPLF